MSAGTRRHHSICGDDKVMLAFVSTESEGRLPSQIKESYGFHWDNGRNYHMNMTTAPRPLKTINLPTPSAAMPDNPPDIPS